jgi:AbrB family looped-hinge helix DNA binding protein
MQVVHEEGGNTMREHEMESSVSPKGQVTIPVEIRRMMGVKPKDKVVFSVAEGRVELKPARSALDALYLSVPALHEPRTWDEIEAIAHEDRAERLADEGRD